MYINEIIANERILDCKYKWFSINISACQIESIKCIKKWSILFLYTCNEFVDWEIIHESFDIDLFIQFLKEHVISHITSYPNSRSILIMNNAKIHHDKILKISLNSVDNNEFKIYTILPKLYSHIYHHTLQTWIRSKKTLQNSKLDVRNIIQK